MGAVIRVWGNEYPVPDKLTLGESADIEKILDGAEPGSREAKSRMLLATVWIACRRVDPTATLDAIRALTMDDIEAAEVPDPVPRAGTPTGESSESATPETSGTR